MAAEFHQSYDGILPTDEPGLYCKEPSDSGYRNSNETSSGNPAKNERPPKLLDQLKEALRALHYSPRTESTYCQWVKRFIFFHNVRHPAEMAEPEINAFLIRTLRKAGEK
jgi:hypothetical protein